MTIGFGGDGPEGYGRALYEADTNPTVGWRPGTHQEIVLIADNIPHDPTLNEGLDPSKWLKNPFDSGNEFPGKDGIPGSLWKPGTDVQIRNVATMLKTDGRPLESVEFFGAEDGYLPYWEYWAGLSGGQALNGSSGALASTLLGIVTSGACGGTCTHATGTQVICNLVTATAEDTCTATVGDAAVITPTNPTGTVTFASSAGGSFPLGTTCALVATPLSSNTSSCSVQFRPPTAASALPAITATYGGDAIHSASAGSTKYGAASELVTLADLAEGGTVKGTEVDIPTSCGFPCTIGGSLLTGPDLGSSASIASAGEVVLLAEGASRRRRKRRSRSCWAREP